MGHKMKTHERKPLFALALSLLLTGLGHIYNGKPFRGILFFISSVVFPLVMLQLSVVGSDHLTIVFLSGSFLTSIVIYIWAAVDSVRLSRHTGASYILKSYNKLWIYLLFILSVNFIIYGPLFDSENLGLHAKPFKSMTRSMLPNLLPGDLVIVDSRVDRSSETLGLKRGELVVFWQNKTRKMPFVKRIIGLPGDDIEMKGMQLFINGKKRTIGKVPLAMEERASSTGEKTVSFYEQGDAGNYCVDYYEGWEREDLRKTVPAGHFFVLGDSRDNSIDSRQWGMIPFHSVEGSVRQIYFSKDPDGGIRWQRIGKTF